MEAIRMCIACRQRAERNTLLRIVLRDGQLVVDERAVLPGRGSWVHPVNECLNQAVSRKLFARALRASTKVDVSPLENWMRNPYGQLMNGSK